MYSLQQIEFSKEETPFKPDVVYEELRPDRLLEVALWSNYQRGNASSVFDQDAEVGMVFIRETTIDGQVVPHKFQMEPRQIDSLIDKAAKDKQYNTERRMERFVRRIFIPTPLIGEDSPE
jgi:hypothetical protein